MGRRECQNVGLGHDDWFRIRGVREVCGGAVGAQNVEEPLLGVFWRRGEEAGNRE